ncbi:hypothetical protein IBX65_08970, partial [Candidatus Aerophobetes bacterium]|nr:hypothetical protein [Candidatus Aerophobetes bacterium]
ELGPGWLLPWQIPFSLRKFDSEDAFWLSSAGEEEILPGMNMHISLLLAMPLDEREKSLDSLIASLAREIAEQGLASSLSAEHISSATILFLQRAQFFPSLARKMELACEVLQEMQQLMQDMMEEEQLATEEGLEAGYSLGRLLAPLAKPVQGMSSQQIKQIILQEASLIKRMSEMVYAKCDNWKALTSEDADPSLVHFGQVAVKLLVLDRDKMGEAIDDLEQEEAAPLQNSLNQALGELASFAIEVYKKERESELSQLKEHFEEMETFLKEEMQQVPEKIDEQKQEAIDKIEESFQAEMANLQERLQSVQDTAAQKAIRDEIARKEQQQTTSIQETSERFEQEKQQAIRSLQEELQALQASNAEELQQVEEEWDEELAYLEKNLPRMQVEVYTRDFGDNCYVVNLKGHIETVEYAFPFADINACLRNGNAVVFISLSGNFTQQQFKEELDHFLSEMDARTAFFRE